MRALADIGKEFSADKAWNKSQDTNYCEVYDRYFSPIRTTASDILELGVSGGSSLRMWRLYFEAARIWGVDVNPASAAQAADRTSVITCSQDDRDTLHNILLPQVPNGFDVIIDDASHITELTLSAFSILSPAVKPGGFYCIEDSLSFYDNDIKAESVRGSWPGMQYNRENINWINSRKDMNYFLNDVIHGIDFDKSIWEYLHIYQNIIILKRRCAL
jgi:hypothetical protein